MDNTWTHTKSALRELENLLLCGYCNELVQNPKGLGNCEHFFCSTCVEQSIGNTCPVCGLPSHVKDISTSRQLTNAVSLCQNLSFLLMRDILNIPDTPTRLKTKQKRTRGCNPGTHPSTAVNVTVKVRANTKAGNSSPMQQRVTRKTTAKRSNLPDNIAVKVRKKGEILATQEEMVQKVTSSALSEDALQCKARSGQRNRKKVLSSVETDKMVVMPPAKALVTRTPITRAPSTPVTRTPGTLITRTPSTPVIKTSVTRIPSTPVRRTSVTRAPVSCTSANRTPVRKVGPTQGTSGCMKKNPKGETLLHVAVIKGDYDRVHALLEQGAEVNTKDNAGWTPLHEASNHGYIALVELLLDSGSFVNVPGYDNETPLHDAVTMNHIEVVRLLLARGADKQAKNLSGRIPHDLAKSDVMRAAIDETSADSQLDSSVMMVPSVLAVGPVVILVTGLSRDDRACVRKCASLLHGLMVVDYCDEVTHLITPVNKDGLCPRTLKFLQVLLSGKWIVNKDWIDTCLEYGHRVSEEAFEVPGCSTNLPVLAPNKARLNSNKQLPGLFDGCHFFLAGSFSYPTLSRTELCELVLDGGGRLLSRLPKVECMDEYEMTVPYHARPDSVLSRCSHYIVTDSRHDSLERLHPRLCKTTPIWMVDCIARFELLDEVQSTH